MKKVLLVLSHRNGKEIMIIKSRRSKSWAHATFGCKINEAIGQLNVFCMDLHGRFRSQNI
jgi:hypothetical protein